LLPSFLDFNLLVSEPSHVHSEVKAKGMNRIVDVEKVLASLAYPGETGQIAIEVKDDFCDWNTGTFAAAWEAGKVTVGRKDIPADLSCSIQVLTQLVTGYASLRELQAFAGVRVAANAPLLNSIFTKKMLFIRDGF
jgi:predicted acetyltransferase